MGQLFDRISQAVKANLNTPESKDSSNDTGEGAALIAGAAAVGASISATVGGIGLAVAGTGMAIGSAVVAGAGAVAGVAADEAKKVIEGENVSALGAAALEAIVSGGTTPVAIGGSLLGLGTHALDQILQQGTDEEKCLDQAITEMEQALLQLHLAFIESLARQKRTQQQSNQTQAEVNKWQELTQLALQNGDNTLARQAIICQKSQAEKVKVLKAQLEQQESQVSTLKHNLAAIKEKLEQAKTKRDELKARLTVVKLNEQLHSSTNNAMAACEILEDKVLEMEACSQAIDELESANLEAQFAAFEAESNINEELAAMKAQLLDSDAYKQEQELFLTSDSSVDD
ncbi:PspA/IM30 family protein [Lyngbya aestuarii]|uniref:PspA/IM30 family protein n=1 Tax=Lyngbya aestuarii TaxID=118322 RepID=UPI00403E0D3E